VSGFGFRVLGFGFGIQASWIRDSCFRGWGLGSKPQGLRLSLNSQRLAFRVWDYVGFRV
jgi:hypothetical protein